MSTLAFLMAVYNETDEIIDSIRAVRPYVDTIVISDDGSTDYTVPVALATKMVDVLVLNPHRASCEETRLSGLQRVSEDWVLILDADERIDSAGLQKIRESIEQLDREGITHVYFGQDEYIDGIQTRSFAKIKLARTDKLHLPERIHGEISVEGESTNLGVRVFHRKTRQKQIMRETEYIRAYKKKIQEGKMTESDAQWAINMHYFIKRVED